MAPESIQEARRDYASSKRNTAIFKDWLKKAATSCWWKSSEAPYTPTTTEIAEQIKVVSESQIDEHKIPEDVHLALRKAIEERRSCNEFFSSAKLTSHESHNKHVYFIEILEYAAATLPRRSSADGGLDTPLPTAKTPRLIDDPEKGWTIVQRKGRKSRPNTRHQYVPHC
ncbi:hypothetical protein F4806DRAFT_499740 [Annulohypoxylon nitens]|nr:hypothetical protein F4806DRAFT_499740 [Annulohypoxylon nitens]